MPSVLVSFKRIQTMKVKTYGIHGLSEWHGKVKAGSIAINVSFTGGTASPSGAQPAYFMTKDPITQFVIENSKEFKQGFIILVMQQEAPGDHPRMAVPKTKDAPQPTGDVETEASEDEVVVTEASEGTNIQKIVVPSLEDAKTYLVENFGISRTKLRSRKQIEDAAAANGVNFVFS